METLNRKDLIKEYCKKHNLKKDELYYSYYRIALYKLKNFYSIDPLDDFIENFLDDCLPNSSNYNSYTDLIIYIKNFNVLYFASMDTDDSIMFSYNLINSYEAFYHWLDINERNEFSIVETIQQAQEEAYYNLYNAIRNDLIKFLNKKNKNALKKSS